MSGGARRTIRLPEEDSVSGPAQRVDFGLFDWIDFSRPGQLGGRYEQRLKMLEQADQLGFFCYHLAEHHLTPLGGAPSPGIFLAAATQRTKRIRLGPLVFVLPLYTPLRLAEEICMLDHLSGGRLELGTGRGISPLELAIANVSDASSREVYEESFRLILDALTTRNVGPHEGKHYAVPRKLDLIVEPVQKPYPPLWYPAGSREVAQKLGDQAINTVTRFENTAEVRAIFDTYKDAWARNQGDPKRLNAHVAQPKLGLLRQIYVAESRERALREGKAAWDAHRAAFLHLWEQHGMAERAASLKDFEASTHNGGVLFSTPGEVAERLAEQLEATGANYVCANFSFGDLSTAQLETSLGLFAREVMPRLGG